MSALAQRQAAFLGAILDEAAPLPAGWKASQGRGFAIYRNNYRSALIEALRSTFERTERLVGEAAFRQAAAHHCIAHPPSSWTLDLAGAGFPETCAELFANDPDVAELAALEWAMHTVFVVRDAQALGVAEFGTACAGFGEADWEGLRLSLVPGVSVLEASFDLVRLWSSLASEEGEADLAALESAHCAIVWREGERPVFVLRPAWEGAALLAFQRGATFAEVCAGLVDTLGEDAAIAEAGAMLARWVGEGLVEQLA
ncbi:HvfC/BufC N-terminal domain-containing protein [Qipengyuania flava]|uniref:HvfC/BufC N-terminal domain-containing protein n=1 Tax=Qipengyuania flava TaxID=192812 RepID=UPI001C63286E|nr:DNA-binding domain-containing protein [Qipengyuania flava]QYJ07666.1 DNA-binding domain-containing protein [Qipengyuania flava]